MRAARAAGWRRADLWWERLQERANRDWEAGARGRALRGFLRAHWLARAFFPSGDPRRATSVANAAFAACARGAERTAARRYATAIRLWAEVPESLDGLALKPRARSSLFHLRMEVLHGDTYRANQRTRLARFVAEADEALAALAAGRPAPVPLFARWKGAKPPVFDDGRKLLAACLLIRCDSRVSAGREWCRKGNHDERKLQETPTIFKTRSGYVPQSPWLGIVNFPFRCRLH